MKNLEDVLSVAQVKAFIAGLTFTGFPSSDNEELSKQMDMLLRFDMEMNRFGLEVHYLVWNDVLYFKVEPLRAIKPIEQPTEGVKIGKIFVFSGTMPKSLDDRSSGIILGSTQFDFEETLEGFQILVPVSFPGRPGYVRIYDINETCISQMSLEDSPKVEVGQQLMINIPKFKTIDEESPGEDPGFSRNN